MTITHTFVSAIGDNSADAAAGKVVPSNWNDDHTITSPLVLDGVSVYFTHGGNIGINQPSPNSYGTDWRTLEITGAATNKSGVSRLSTSDASVVFDSFCGDDGTVVGANATSSGGTFRAYTNHPLKFYANNTVVGFFDNSSAYGFAAVAAGTPSTYAARAFPYRAYRSDLLSSWSHRFGAWYNGSTPYSGMSWEINWGGSAWVTGVALAAIDSGNCYVGINGISAPAYALDVNGDVVADKAGSGFRIKEGSNARMGVATLSGGAVVVSNNTVTASTRIFLTTQSLGTVTVPTAIAVTARSNGVSFTITSANVVDTSVVAWELKEPA